MTSAKRFWRDVVVEQAGGGIDTVELRVVENTEDFDIHPTYHLSEFVENLNFSGLLGFNGYGNDENNIITTSHSSRLYGLNGDDTLYGSIGGDRLEGGSGRDAM